MKLTDLLSTAAAGGTATLTDDHGDTLDLNAFAAARLVAAVAEDRVVMGLWGMPSLDAVTVALEDAERDSRPRKTLGWETPAERLAKLLATAS